MLPQNRFSDNKEELTLPALHPVVKLQHFFYYCIMLFLFHLFFFEMFVVALRMVRIMLFSVENSVYTQAFRLIRLVITGKSVAFVSRITHALFHEWIVANRMQTITINTKRRNERERKLLCICAENNWLKRSILHLQIKEKYMSENSANHLWSTSEQCTKENNFHWWNCVKKKLCNERKKGGSRCCSSSSTSSQTLIYFCGKWHIWREKEI